MNLEQLLSHCEQFDEAGTYYVGEGTVLIHTDNDGDMIELVLVFKDIDDQDRVYLNYHNVDDACVYDVVGFNEEIDVYKKVT